MNSLTTNPVKTYIQELLQEQLQNFELVEGGQQRTVGDLIEHKVLDILNSSTSQLISEKKKARSKKSIEDITLISNGVTYYIDPKTHNKESDFSMPNLTAITKLKKLFSKEKKELIYVFVGYTIENKTVIVENINVCFVWELDISMLGVGALGKGQLQIKDAHDTLVLTNKGKDEWFKDFKVLVQQYLKKQIIKINKQILEWN
jgi:hypothetical protein